MARYRLISTLTGAVLGQLALRDTLRPVVPAGTRAELLDLDQADDAAAWTWDAAMAGDPGYPHVDVTGAPPEPVSAAVEPSTPQAVPSDPPQG